MTAPTISVCVPTYNGSAYLAETLASISAQTFDDLEILIVDDGSSDDTRAIAERFATTERRARVVRNAERAGSSARNANKCLDHARGEWIKFIFQDDLMAPTCLSRMLEAGRRGPLVIAWHDYWFAPDIEPRVRSITRPYLRWQPSFRVIMRRLSPFATPFSGTGESTSSGRRAAASCIATASSGTAGSAPTSSRFRISSTGCVSAVTRVSPSCRSAWSRSVRTTGRSAVRFARTPTAHSPTSLTGSSSR